MLKTFMKVSHSYYSPKISNGSLIINWLKRYHLFMVDIFLGLSTHFEVMIWMGDRSLHTNGSEISTTRSYNFSIDYLDF